MVAVLTKHIDHIALGPLLEITVIAVFTFCDVPFVKRLYHHHEAHLVAKTHQFGCRHVVGGPDGITPHVLQQGQLMAEGGLIDGGSQRTEVVMIAHPLKLAALAIEKEALVRHNFHGPDAEAGGIRVLQPASGINPGVGAIEVRRLRRPQQRCRHRQMLLEGLLVEDAALVGVACHHLAVRTHNIGHDRQLFLTGILDSRLKRNGRIVFFHMRHRQPCTPHGYVYFSRTDHPHVTIESCTGIPT